MILDVINKSIALRSVKLKHLYEFITDDDTLIICKST